jgi:urease accessory protein
MIPDASLLLVRVLRSRARLLIGAYSYSQGLEWIVEEGTVRDAKSARAWIGDVLDHVMATGEAAVVWRLLLAAERVDWQAVARWNAWFRASRETAELRAETEQMGGSLARPPAISTSSTLRRRRFFPARARHPVRVVRARRARVYRTPDAVLTAYVWSWLENQCWLRSKPCRWGRPPASGCCHACEHPRGAGGGPGCRGRRRRELRAGCCAGVGAP